jgi:hypothetical protein
MRTELKETKKVRQLEERALTMSKFQPFIEGTMNTE